MVSNVKAKRHIFRETNQTLIRVDLNLSLDRLLGQTAKPIISSLS